MYRVAAKISDQQIDDLVGNFCRSNGGCLRTILWKRDDKGTVPSTKLRPEKFDPAHDQTGRGEKCIPASLSGSMQPFSVSLPREGEDGRCHAVGALNLGTRQRMSLCEGMSASSGGL